MHRLVTYSTQLIVWSSEEENIPVCSNHRKTSSAQIQNNFQEAVLQNGNIHLSSTGFCHFPRGLFRKYFVYFTLAYRGELHISGLWFFFLFCLVTIIDEQIRHSKFFFNSTLYLFLLLLVISPNSNWFVILSPFSYSKPLPRSTDLCFKVTFFFQKYIYFPF